jgi:hypothetical protein
VYPFSGIPPGAYAVTVVANGFAGFHEENVVVAAGHLAAINASLKIDLHSTDKLHGDYFVQGNNSSFNSRNPYTTTQPPYHFTDMQGDINGRSAKSSLSSWVRSGRPVTISPSSTPLCLRPPPVAAIHAGRLQPLHQSANRTSH